MIQLSARKNVYYNIGHNFVSVKSWKYCFQTQRKVYELQNYSEASPPAPKLISYLPVYSMKRIALASRQGLALLVFFLYALIIFSIIVDH